jgi:hypothetical protein
MLKSRSMILAVICACAPFATAKELPAKTIARLLKIISGGQGVACQGGEVAVELTRLSIPVDPSAKVAFASTDGQVTRFRSDGKLVVCGRMEQINLGATLALVDESGAATIYIKKDNAAASHVAIPDSVLRIAKEVK